MILNQHECRYLLRLIAENTEGHGYANTDERIPDGSDEGQYIGKLQAKLSMLRDADIERNGFVDTGPMPHEVKSNQPPNCS